MLLFFKSFATSCVLVMECAPHKDVVLYQQAVCLVMLASMYQFCLSRVIHEFFRMWMEVLSGWLYVGVKIEAYADNCLMELTA